MRTSPLCARVPSVPPLPQFGLDTEAAKPCTFIPPGCLSPHPTSNHLCSQWQEAQDQDSVLLSRTRTRGDRGHCVESSLSPRGLCSNGLSRLRSAADLPPDPRLLPSVACRCGLNRPGFRGGLTLCTLGFATRKKEAALHCSSEFVPISTSFTSSFWFIF